jgi:GNAT superfamily N-acetyltransferase
MHVTLRRATADDLPFARRLYLENIRDVSRQIGFSWDETQQTVNFDARFIADEVSIICLDGQDIGWMQIAESERELFLKQLFVHPTHQRRGIGTSLLQELIKRAAHTGKTVALGVVKGNPARWLYERHGFQVTSEDDYKVYMVIEP